MLSGNDNLTSDKMLHTRTVRIACRNKISCTAPAKSLHLFKNSLWRSVICVCTGSPSYWLSPNIGVLSFYAFYQACEILYYSHNQIFISIWYDFIIHLKDYIGNTFLEFFPHTVFFNFFTKIL